MTILSDFPNAAQGPQKVTYKQTLRPSQPPRLLSASCAKRVRSRSLLFRLATRISG